MHIPKPIAVYPRKIVLFAESVPCFVRKTQKFPNISRKNNRDYLCVWIHRKSIRVGAGRADCVCCAEEIFPGRFPDFPEKSAVSGFFPDLSGKSAAAGQTECRRRRGFSGCLRRIPPGMSVRERQTISVHFYGIRAVPELSSKTVPIAPCRRPYAGQRPA